MSHHGEPAEEEEVIVVVEPERPCRDEPRVVRAPRVPTQEERDAHEATHIPHEEWCEVCVAGRCRNKAHRKKKEAPGSSSDVDSPGASSEEGEPVKGPVPRVCMDYFYVSSRKGGHAMSTQELQRKLREMGKSDQGQRGVLIKRYEMYADHEDQAEVSEETQQGPHASERPMMVMVDESTGDKYMRAVDHKGLGPEGDLSWLVKDMHQELKAWGHPGGGRNEIILKSDGEPAIVAVREALARCHGGQVTPEHPPRGNTRPMAWQRSQVGISVTK